VTPPPASIDRQATRTGGVDSSERAWTAGRLLARRRRVGQLEAAAGSGIVFDEMV
jgi:hypothetical protein